MQQVIGISFISLGLVFLLLYFLKPKFRTHLLALATILTILIGGFTLIPSSFFTSGNSTENDDNIMIDKNGNDEVKPFVWLSELTPEDNDNTSGFKLYETVKDNLSNIYQNGFGGSNSYEEKSLLSIIFLAIFNFFCGKLLKHFHHFSVIPLFL